MSTTIPLCSAVTSLASAGVSPLLALAVSVTVVTIVALCRTKKEDIPRVFEAFASAFGIHRHPDCSGPERGGDAEEPTDPVQDEERGRSEEGRHG
ncbi:hypothetical protein [Nocardia ninae]|uniref:hypothetical protein n=1 Tax=Nocardia ninae TaxID=356145 RepID=UPI0011BDD1DB|nr:hypothetical protein [Nocardia ninae]